MRRGEAALPPGRRSRHGKENLPAHQTPVWWDWWEHLFPVACVESVIPGIRQVHGLVYGGEGPVIFAMNERTKPTSLQCKHFPLASSHFSVVRPSPGPHVPWHVPFFSRSLAFRREQPRGCVWVFVGVSRGSGPRPGWGSRGRTGGTGPHARECHPKAPFRNRASKRCVQHRNFCYVFGVLLRRGV